MLSVDQASKLLHGNEGIIALSYLLDLSLGEVRRQGGKILQPEEERAYLTLVKKRKAGLPLQYAIGQWDFYGRTFRVDSRALIPRPETELLVEEVLKRGVRGKRVLEIGTGTGIIPITLALETLENGPPNEIIATDLSPDALALAKENQDLLDPEKKTKKLIRWVRGDLFDAFTGQADWLISNPPYVPEKGKEALQKELFYEPFQALFAGPDGLALYQRLIFQAPPQLKEGGKIALEIGDDQALAVKDLLRKAGFQKIEIRKDLCGRDRMVFAQKKTKGGDLV